MPIVEDTMFLSQSTLEAWLETGRAECSGESIALAGRDYGFELLPAFRFLNVVDGDPNSPLLGKVVPEDVLLQVGAELLGSSAVLEETAFEVVPGFIARLRYDGASHDDAERS